MVNEGGLESWVEEANSDVRREAEEAQEHKGLVSNRLAGVAASTAVHNITPLFSEQTALISPLDSSLLA